MTENKRSNHTLTELERLYIKRRRAGHMLAPVRTAPTHSNVLGDPVKVSTRYRKPGDWFLGYHTGADFACPIGSRAVATTWGRVVWVGERGGWSAAPRPGGVWAYGLHVVIRTGDGRFDYALCHLSQAHVKVGDSVRPGQIVGLTGNSGNSTGPHCHVEARPAGGRYGSDVAPALVRRRTREKS